MRCSFLFLLVISWVRLEFDCMFHVRGCSSSWKRCCRVNPIVWWLQNLVWHVDIKLSAMFSILLVFTHTIETLSECVLRGLTCYSTTLLAWFIDILELLLWTQAFIYSLWMVLALTYCCHIGLIFTWAGIKILFIFLFLCHKAWLTGLIEWMWIHFNNYLVVEPLYYCWMSWLLFHVFRCFYPLLFQLYFWFDS